MKIQALFLLVLIAFALAEPHPECPEKGFKSAKEIIDGSCLIKSYHRGKGIRPEVCERDEELVDHVCLKKCREGFKTFGTLCIKECEKGLIDTGDFCKKPELYKRECFPCDQKKKCIEKSPTSRCEKFDEKFCETCKKGFHPVGLLVCVPDCKGCPPEHKKEIYPRTPGHKPECPRELELSRGLCYHHCKPKFNGVGPICWEDCPKDLERCGFFCVKPGCAWCTIHTDHVLKEVGMMIELLLPGSHKGHHRGHHRDNRDILKLKKAELIAKAEKKCSKLKGEKIEKCIKKFIKLIEVIPNKTPFFKLRICKEKRHHGGRIIHLPVAHKP